jgi:hypothetical protein
LSDPENERKRELECLRLASDLRQLASDALDPELSAHCVRMAKVWSDKCALGPAGNSSVESVLYH